MLTVVFACILHHFLTSSWYILQYTLYTHMQHYLKPKICYIVSTWFPVDGPYTTVSVGSMLPWFCLRNACMVVIMPVSLPLSTLMIDGNYRYSKYHQLISFGSELATHTLYPTLFPSSPPLFKITKPFGLWQQYATVSLNWLTFSFFFCFCVRNYLTNVSKFAFILGQKRVFIFIFLSQLFLTPINSLFLFYFVFKVFLLYKSVFVAFVTAKQFNIFLEKS